MQINNKYQRIAVCGTGGSINDFEGNYDLSIGVNDIWKCVKTDIIVCVDHPRVFNPARLKIINESKPQKFYSQIVQWDYRPDFEKIVIRPNYTDSSIDLSLPGYYKSFCSPFIAVQIAYKIYYAEEIHLWGVDMTNHPHLDQKLCQKIKTHFRHLQIALIRNSSRIIVHGQGILTELNASPFI